MLQISAEQVNWNNESLYPYEQDPFYLLMDTKHNEADIYHDILILHFVIFVSTLPNTWYQLKIDMFENLLFKKN